MFDFLYADHERVASLISQIEGVGSLVGYERSYEKEKSATGKAKVSLLPLSVEGSGGTNLNKQLRQEYDPLWINSQRLVDVVAENSSGNDDELSYGKLLTVSGKLICLDQSFINDLLKGDALIQKIAESVESDSPEKSQKVQRKERNEMAKTIRDFLQSLPLGIVFILISEGRAFWFNVKKEFLALQALDIPLKFPVTIGGEWHVTGLIDAMPQDHGDIMSEFDTTGSKRVLPQAFEILVQLVVPLVGLFGRPSDSYGLSPVTIHRQISF